MNVRQYRALALRETDVLGAMHRVYDNEAIYARCLNAFLDDPTVGALNDTVTAGAWDDAFTAAHALKGVAGNMGFIPLMHAVAQLIVAIRGGRVAEVPEFLEQVNSSYRDIADGIRQYFSCADEDGEEKKA